MTSILRTTAQTPSIVGFLKGEQEVGTTTASFLYDPIPFVVGQNGVIRIDGGNVFFNSYANAQAFFNTPIPTNYFTVGQTDYYRDLGKTIQIYVQRQVQQFYVYDHVLTLTHVQAYYPTSNTGLTEGVTSTVINGEINYITGYVATWTANPDDTTGIPVAVARVGHQ